MFERRQGSAFHFNSGRLGKFIECEFERAFAICRSRLVPIESEDFVRPTFVIQASQDRKVWFTYSACRFKKNEPLDVKFKNNRPYKFWRYVLVDHATRENGQSNFRGIGWFVKEGPFSQQRAQTTAEAKVVATLLSSLTRVT